MKGVVFCLKGLNKTTLFCCDSQCLPSSIPLAPITTDTSALTALIRKTKTSEPKNYKLKTKLRGRSPQANYTDRATAACRRS
jgi:hypothetical protein